MELHKGVQDLITAFKAVAAENEISYLLIVGHGDYEEELKRVSAKHPRIIFTGNIEYERIHEAYFASDPLVLPTYHDAWGLVINEALACDLPVITTTAAGASFDLVPNGFVYSAGCVNTLLELLRKAILENAKRKLNSIDILEWTFSQARCSMERVLKTTLK